MQRMMRAARDLRDDDLTRRVLASSGVLFGSNSLSLVLTVAQSILAARLLGPAGYGMVAIVMAYSSTVNGLLSFRMSELVVRYAGEYLDRSESTRAAAVVKAAALAEAGVSGIAFLFVLATANVAAQYIAKSPANGWMFVVFALGLLVNFNTETSTGVLQVLGRIRIQGPIQLAQSAVTLILMVAALLTHGSVALVLYIYLLGKLINGLAMVVGAAILLTRRLGAGWWKARLGVLPRPRELITFAVSSNLSATAILIFRESEVLWVGYFLTAEAAGFYKAAHGLAGLLAVPANPLILSTYPEINRLAVQGAWMKLRAFLRRITSLAVAYNLLLGLGFVVLGRWLLGIYGPEYVAGYPALLALLVGLVFNYSLFWNRPLLLALGMPEYAVQVVVLTGLAKTLLAFAIVPSFGILAAAGLLCFYYAASVGLMAWRGVRELRARGAA